MILGAAHCILTATYRDMNMDEKKKVLIVEDNDLNQKLFVDLLEAHGFVTVHTRDGNEVVELAQKEQPNLIIMDIQLPNISGIDVIKQIKKTPVIKNIPILAVTAFAMQDDEEQILATGCEGYLAKPISIEPFIETVKHYLK